MMGVHLAAAAAAIAAASGGPHVPVYCSPTVVQRNLWGEYSDSVERGGRIDVAPFVCRGASLAVRAAPLTEPDSRLVGLAVVVILHEQGHARGLGECGAQHYAGRNAALVLRKFLAGADLGRTIASAARWHGAVLADLGCLEN